MINIKYLLEATRCYPEGEADIFNKSSNQTGCCLALMSCTSSDANKQTVKSNLHIAFR